MVRSLIALSLCLLGGGCQQLFGLDKVPDPPRPDGLLPDTPPGECGHRDVATGRHHTCAIDAAGAVWCWGQNTDWQVLGGAGDIVVDPVRIEALPAPAVQVAAGRSVSCARLTDGSVWCWGKNENGELGIGVQSDRGLPTAVNLGTEKAIDLDVGGYHVCIRRESDSAAMCWGSNRSKELGDPSANQIALPTLVAGTAGLQTLEVGHRHSCGLAAAGKVLCWGKGEDGQLGAGFVPSPTPIEATGITGATSVGASGRVSCAVVGGIARCWGSNEYGQLGNGTYDAAPAPGSAILTNVVDVGLGPAGGCARRDDGLISCWGNMNPGDGTFSTSPMPRPSKVTAATSLATGFYHVCTIVAGEIQCWGDNGFGELGRGARSISAVPVAVTLPSTVAEVSVAEDHACARLTNNEVWCWGDNGYGQLADGTHSSNYTPVKIATGLASVVGIAVGDRRACAWSASNARCWGSNDKAILGTGTETHDKTSPVNVMGTGLKGFSLGWLHTCALNSSDNVQCWGYNGHGQLGNNTTVDSTTPVTITAAGTVAQIATGASHTCVRKTDDTVACWGENTFGQIGNNTMVDAKAPTAVQGLTIVNDISAGRRSTCAIDSGSVYCWGSNDLGQLGLGDQVNRLVPAKVTLPAPASDIELSAYGACVRLVDGSTYCWGVGDRGQLANGQTPTFEMSPVLVPALSGNSMMSLDGTGGCVVASGAVQCWGGTALLGTGDVSTADPQPTKLVCP